MGMGTFLMLAACNVFAAVISGRQYLSDGNRVSLFFAVGNTVLAVVTAIFAFV